MIDRRAFIGSFVAGTSVGIAGCMGDSEPPKHELLIFQNQYSQAVSVSVQIEQSNTVVFESVLQLKPGAESERHVFDTDEEYIITIESRTQSVEVDEPSAEILLKACGTSPTTYAVEAAGEITAVTVAGCGA